MAQKVLTIILGLIVIAGLAWYVTVNYVQPRSSLSNTVTSKPEIQTSGTSAIVYLAQNKEIWQVDLRNELKKLYTDNDEKFQLSIVSNLDDQKGFVAETADNKLVKVDLKTSHSSQLRNNFSTTGFIILSPDSKIILYTKFSNLDENYGYSLYTEDLDGTNKKVLTTSETEIKSPRFSKDGTKVAYAVSNQQTGQIKLLDLKTKDESTVVEQSGKIIDSLSWLSNDIVFSERDYGNQSKGEIYRLDLATKSKLKLADYDGGIANFLSGNGEYFSWLIAQYKNTPNDKTVGQIFAQKESQDKIPLKKGVQILGWW